MQELATTQAMIPYVVTRNILREFVWHRGDSVHTTTRDGLFIAVRGPTGYRVIAHGDWPMVRPIEPLVWTPPEGFTDSLGNVGAGSYAPWWFAEADQLMAVAPVFSGTVPIGVVVATVPRNVAETEGRTGVLRSAWYAFLALAARGGLRRDAGEHEPGVRRGAGHRRIRRRADRWHPIDIDGRPTR